MREVLPRSLLARSLLIIVMPLVLLQVVIATFFYERHWDTMERRLANSLAGDVALVMALIERHPAAGEVAWLQALVQARLQFDMTFAQGVPLPTADDSGSSDLTVEDHAALVEALNQALPYRFVVGSVDDRHVAVHVAHADGVWTIATTRKRLFSSTTTTFVAWMIGTSLLLFGVAMLFMRNQVRPVRRLAAAANMLGKGRDVPAFKPEGATEVRQAAQAFMLMRDRIRRQIDQRTEMLAGVSHDLRTPLTRLRLGLELLGDSDGVEPLREDVREMDRMLQGYLDFARGEGGEPPMMTKLDDLLSRVVAKHQRAGAVIDLHMEHPITMPLRPVATERCLSNLVGNAVRHAGTVHVRLGQRAEGAEVLIDDDGPGIPADRRKDVFRAFVRLDPARGAETGGTGLGLTIARDIARGHGGDVLLEDSPHGGLRVRVRLPF